MTVEKRLVNAVLTRQEWEAVAPAIKAEGREARPRWELVSVSGYWEDVYIEIMLTGSFWHELDAVFLAHVPGWEAMPST